MKWKAISYHIYISYTSYHIIPYICDRHIYKMHEMEGKNDSTEENLNWFQWLFLQCVSVLHNNPKQDIVAG